MYLELQRFELSHPGERNRCGLHSYFSSAYDWQVNGIAAFGGVYSGTNPAYQIYELVHHLKASKARMVIVQPELLQTLLPAALEVGIPKERVLIFDNPGDKPVDGFASWWTLFEHGERDWPRFNDETTQSETTLARLFSSGTTGTQRRRSSIYS